MRPALLAGCGAAVGLLLLGGAGAGRPAGEPAAAAAVEVGLLDPLPGALETQPFGCTGFDAEPVDAGCTGGHFHSGLDLAAPLGSPVFAAAGGVARLAQNPNGYGLYVRLEHSSRLSTLYAHLAAASVSAGQRVRAGQEIGLVGSSGNSTGPHLHFEVRRDGRPVDPRLSLPASNPEGDLSWLTR